MKLTVVGDINKYYVQTLCMIFFPGAKFSEKEEPDENMPSVFLSLEEKEEEFIAEAVIRARGREARMTRSAKKGGRSDQRTAKIAAGSAMFAAGKELFGFTPPWGILTGVRPAKVASEYLLNGLGVQKIKEIFRDEYFVNPKKAALAVSIASAEIKLTKKLPKNLCSVYISIPFCPSRCAYCSFVSYTSKRLLSLIDDYLLMLYKDIDHVFSLIRELGMQVATIYIGGGTPTILDDRQLETLLSHIARHTDVSNLMEYTLEAGRPDTITAEKLAIAKKYGINRISVNPQSLCDGVLETIGRKHTALDFLRAFDIAKNSGISRINTDLIAGLPGDSFAEFSKSIDRVIELRPDNLTVHTFCVKKSSDVLKNSSNIYSLTGGEVWKSVDYSQVRTRNSGYKPYYMYRQKNTVGNLENVGYSLEGAEGMYNIFMMEELHTIFAAGAGSVTKLVKYRSPKEGGSKITRIFKPKYPYEYLRDFEKLQAGDAEAGILSMRDKILAFFEENGVPVN
ncbi:MAG: coproporphyrinogen dehydrogenase HemZ [Clostridiales bacterium]|nr:coproporphyrinogen dehydrogenase HemZ [Clostridiales bacterium]